MISGRTRVSGAMDVLSIGSNTGIQRHSGQGLHRDLSLAMRSKAMRIIEALLSRDMLFVYAAIGYWIWIIYGRKK